MKKLLSAALVLSMLPAFSIFNAANAEQNKDFEQQKEKLKAFNITINDEYENDSEVTRANFIKTVLEFSNSAPQNTGDVETGFADVDRYYTYAPYIARGAELGYIVGYNNGYYYPEAQITFNQAVKVLVNALGYESMAQNSGGYPNGYLSVAADVGITDGIKTYDDGLKAGDLTKLLLNALECSPCEINFDGSQIKLEENTDIDALWKFHRIVKVKNKIYANDVTGLSDAKDAVQSGYVMLGDEIVKYATTNAADYLGYSVEAYVYYDDDDEPTLKYITEGKKNKVLTVKSEDILDEDAGFSGYNFVYCTESGIRKNIKINKDIKVIYNGLAKPAYGVSDLCPEIGDVTFIDNDSNGIYDCIKIFKVNKAVVINNAVNESKGVTIVDKFKASNTYFYDSEYEHYNITLDGVTNNTACLSENVLALIGDNNEYDKNTGALISKNENHSITRALGSNAAIQGKITSTTNEYVYIDDVEYKLSSFVEGDKLLSGNIGTFWVYDGYLLAYKKGSITVDGELISPDPYEYAYFVSGAIYDYEDTGEEVFLLKLLTEENKFERILCNADTKFNGKKDKSLENAAKIFAESGNSVSNFVWKPQLILYKLNDKGFIKELFTVDGDSEKTLRYEGKVTSPTSGDIVVEKNGKKYSYDGSAYGAYSYYINNFMNAFYQDSNTTVFRINNENIDDSYVTGPFADMINSAGGYEIEMYNVNKDTNAVEVCLMYTSQAMGREKIDGEAKPVIVKSVQQGLNEDDEPIKTIVCDDLSGKITINWNDDLSNELKEVFNSIKPGDIIFYENDGNGKLKNITKSFDVDKVGVYGMGTMNDYDVVHGNWSQPTHLQRRAAYVNVTEKLPGGFLGYRDKNGMDSIQRIEGDSQYYRITVRGSKVSCEKINYSDIKVGDDVYFLIKHTRLTTLFVLDIK